LRHWVIWIIDAEASRDPLELLSCRVSRKQMTLHMPEQTRHLTKYVFGWHEVEELSLCRVKIALRPLDKRPVAEDPADKNEGSLWVQRLRTCRLPGCLKMAANGVGQNLTVLRCGARLFRLRHLPIAQRSEFLSPRQRAFPPGYPHGPPDTANNRLNEWRSRVCLGVLRSRVCLGAWRSG